MNAVALAVMFGSWSVVSDSFAAIFYNPPNVSDADHPSIQGISRFDVVRDEIFRQLLGFHSLTMDSLGTYYRKSGLQRRQHLCLPQNRLCSSFCSRFERWFFECHR